MKKYKVSDFNNRKALDDTVISDFGRTTEVKEATIDGTMEELKKLSLEHNKEVWGVKVIASDYKVNNLPKVKRAIRGERTATKINGKKIK